jgi:uncharacterized protein YbjT (DUF2867 family)
MKLVVFGASGRTGSHLVRLAAARGHQVTAVVRSTTSFTPPPQVRVVTGDVLDPAFVASVVASQDAVASCLGIRYAHPWAARRSPDDFISRATASIVEGMNRSDVRRIVAISAAGVGDSKPILNFMMHILIATSNVGIVYADLERTEDVLRRSGLDWVAVRPTTLSNGAARAGARLTNRFTITASIPREAVAQFMLDELARPEIGNRTPIITG